VKQEDDSGWTTHSLRWYDSKSLHQFSTPSGNAGTYVRTLPQEHSHQEAGSQCWRW
jgi:hypothetical protein